MRRAAVALLALVLLPAAASGQSARKRISGQGERKPAPVLILHDWFDKSPVCSPTYVRDNLAFLESQPFDGLALYLRPPDHSVNVTTSAMSLEPLTYEKIAAVLKPVERLEFTRLSHNFAAVITLRVPDVFEDWSVIVRNMGFLARAAREAGLKGIYLDNENYGKKRWADYPGGVADPKKSLAEYEAQARLRGKQVMEAMTAAFPEITVLTLHGPYVSEPKAPSPLFPSWAHANRLLGPFFAGFVEGTGPKARCVDGGELYHLRSEEEFRQSYEWRKTGLISDRTNCTYIPPALRQAWAGRVDLAFGVYDRGFAGREMSPATMKTTVTQALRRTDRYVWLYVEGRTLLRPGAEGGAEAEWVDAIRQGREEALRQPSK